MEHANVPDFFNQNPKAAWPAVTVCHKKILKICLPDTKSTLFNITIVQASGDFAPVAFPLDRTSD